MDPDKTAEGQAEAAAIAGLSAETMLFTAKCIIIDLQSMDLLPVGHILPDNHNMLVSSPRQSPTILEDLGNLISNQKWLSRALLGVESFQSVWGGCPESFHLKRSCFFLVTERCQKLKTTMFLFFIFVFFNLGKAWDPAFFDFVLFLNCCLYRLSLSKENATWSSHTSPFKVYTFLISNFQS